MELLQLWRYSLLLLVRPRLRLRLRLRLQLRRPLLLQLCYIALAVAAASNTHNPTHVSSCSYVHWCVYVRACMYVLVHFDAAMTLRLAPASPSVLPSREMPATWPLLSVGPACQGVLPSLALFLWQTTRAKEHLQPRHAPQPTAPRRHNAKEYSPASTSTLGDGHGLLNGDRRVGFVFER